MSGIDWRGDWDTAMAKFRTLSSLIAVELPSITISSPSDTCPHAEHCRTLATRCDTCCEGSWPPFHSDPKHPMASHPGHVWECPLCTGGQP